MNGLINTIKKKLKDDDFSIITICTPNQEDIEIIIAYKAKYMLLYLIETEENLTTILSDYLNTNSNLYNYLNTKKKYYSNFLSTVK